MEVCEKNIGGSQIIHVNWFFDGFDHKLHKPSILGCYPFTDVHTQMLRIFAGYCKQVQDETCTSQYLQPGSYGSPEITWRLDMGISPSGTVLDM